ncbi:MAG: lipase family protein [Bacteroidetes bacterium]|nr:lipase family protein [Bacteroidota bacterium]
MKNIFLLIFILLLVTPAFSQTKLKPGFDPQEYKTLLEITARQVDTPWTKVEIPAPENCKMVFRSDTVGLDNRWDLWIRSDSVGIISIRGTTAKPNSWSENYLAAMVPAKGSLRLASSDIFVYKLAESEKASVHTGWLTGLAYLSESIVLKINTMYSQGIKDYIIIGHSQGGAISYLLTSYLHYLSGQRFPADIKFKTYCSAPPKPGNMEYSYDYDYITRGGWSLRVYNTEDWVPQTPFSLQTLDDYAEINPYSERDSFLVKMNLVEKLIFDYIVGRLSGSLNDTRDILTEYFGKAAFKFSFSKYLKDFPEPVFTKDTYFYPCGVPVVLDAGRFRKGYDEVIENEKDTPLLFKNHMVPPYYYLLNEIYLK